MVRAFPLVAAVALLAACNGAGGPAETPAVEQTAAPAFSAPASTAGRLSMAGGELRFRPCGEAAATAVRDLPDGEGSALVQEFGGDAGITVMARVEGGAIQEIRYAGLDGPDCDRLPPDADVQARGNEPFWRVDVDGSTATLRTPEAIEGIQYFGGAWTRPADGQWRFEATRAEPAGSLALELTEGRCADSMSGARYPYRAAVTVDGQRMDGCALEGRR